jgi:hypothetical protein
MWSSLGAVRMNAVEQLRKVVVTELLSLGTMKKVWPIWKPHFQKITNGKSPSAKELQVIGNELYNIFKTTSSGRDQSDVSGGGAAWEALICWYLNLCLLGSNTVVIKSKKANIPPSISHAISVNYGNFASNTESDLLAITFPDDPTLSVAFTGKHSELMELLSTVIESKFIETELGIIQCKTNWNDNAQIPMLWDLIYASSGFSTNARVGSNGFSHTKLSKFTYSFVTVPTVKPEKFKPTSTSVMRVKNLSGGNYWGLPSQKGIASNIFNIIQNNFSTSHSSYPNGWHKDISNEISKMLKNQNYFML